VREPVVPPKPESLFGPRALRRVFALLLRAFPSSYRCAVGEDLLELIVDQSRDAMGRRGAFGLALFTAAMVARVLVLAKAVPGGLEETIQMASDRALGRFAEVNPKAAQWSDRLRSTCASWASRSGCRW